MVWNYFLGASTRLAATTMTAYLGVKVGFVMYLYLKNTVRDTLGSCVSSTHSYKHWLCSYDVPSAYAFFQCYANILRCVGLSWINISIPMGTNDNELYLWGPYRCA